MMTYEQLAQAYAQACRQRDMAMSQLEDIGAGYAEKMDDFARIVRCKNCRYYAAAKANEKGFLICPASGMDITENDFCSYGEADSFE